MKKLIEKIYFEVDSDTRSQLTKDFGHFPPAGLVVDESNYGRFSVAYANRLGFLYYYVARLPAIIAISKRSMSDQMDSLLEKYEEVKSIFRSLNVLKKIVVTVVMSVVIVPVFAYLVCYGCVSVIRSIVGMNEPGIGGCFIPTPSGEPKFAVRREAFLAAGDKLEGVVAHEHVHLLQYVHFLRSADLRLVSVEDPRIHGLVKAKYASNSFVLYLFRKEEVEARLHELVLSFYRVNGCFPGSLEGLVGLVALNAHENAGLMQILDLEPDYFFDRFSYRSYSTRYEPMGRQMSTIFMCIDDLEDQVRFLLEVLSVMYANLLEYYGDVGASNRFRSLINSPGLYDRLYC